MKNKKIIRKFTVLLAALVIMCGFSVTAYAGGVILSRLVDTFISKISLTMQPGPKIDSISGA